MTGANEDKACASDKGRICLSQGVRVVNYGDAKLVDRFCKERDLSRVRFEGALQLR